MDMAKPIIRFKGYQDDWEQRKLGDIADVTKLAGFEFTEHVVYSDEGNVIALRGLNIKNGQLILDDVKYIDGSNFSKLSRSKLFIDDIMFTYVGTVGEVAIIKENDRFYLAPNVSRIRVKSDDSPKFISHYMRTDNFKNKVIFPLIATSSQPALSMENIRKFTINIPTSREEQDCLAKYFDSLDHLITLHQRKCDETKKLKKYMLQKMFPQNGEKVPEIRFSGFTDDWEQRKLGDLVIDHNAGIYISKEDYGEGTNVIGVGNIYDRDIFDGEIYRLGPVNDDKFILDENDILYGESSLVPEGIARTVCVGKNGAGSAFAWHTRRVKLDKNIVNSHVATLELNYLHDIRKYLVSVSTQTALTGMTTEGYFGVTLTLPSVEEQQKISDYFKNLDTLITLHQRELENLQNIKKFMLEKMFV